MYSGNEKEKEKKRIVTLADANAEPGRGGSKYSTGGTISGPG